MNYPNFRTPRDAFVAERFSTIIGTVLTMAVAALGVWAIVMGMPLVMVGLIVGPVAVFAGCKLAASISEQERWEMFPPLDAMLAVITWDLAVDSDDPKSYVFPYLSYEPNHRAVLVGAWFRTFGVPDGLTCTPTDYEFPLYEMWPLKPVWFDSLT